MALARSQYEYSTFEYIKNIYDIGGANSRFEKKGPIHPSRSYNTRSPLIRPLTILYCTSRLTSLSIFGHSPRLMHVSSRLRTAIHLPRHAKRLELNSISL